jgi:hypothetical protein
VVAAATLAWPSAARAQSAAPSPEATAVPASAHPSAPPRFWLAARVGGAIDRGAVFASVGARWDVVPRLQLGLAVEYNPWIDPLSFSATPGTANAYVSGSFRWTSTPGFEVRSGLAVGASLLTGDLVGARAGSVGPFVGISLLSVAVALNERVWLEIDPQVVLEVPDVQGVPLLNHQYRLAVGLRFGL